VTAWYAGQEGTAVLSTEERASNLTLNAGTHLNHKDGDTKPYSMSCLDYS